MDISLVPNLQIGNAVMEAPASRSTATLSLQGLVSRQEPGQRELRSVDESDEDYLHPADYSMSVDLPPAAQAVLEGAA